MVAGVLAVLFFASLYFATDIFAFLVQPLLAAGEGKIIFTDVFEAFFVEVKVALFTALMIGFPFFAIQLWKFVAPGLYAKEKMALLPFLLLTPVFFIGGAAFAYYLAMPWALHFLLGYQGDVGGVERDACRNRQLFEFLTRFLFGFGVAFLLPVLLMVLERAGIVTREQLTKSRRYAIVGAVAIAAVLTPPDAVSQLMLAVPLYLLYEFAILAIRLTHWRQGRRAARLGSKEGEPRTNEARKRHGGEGWRFRPI